MTLMPIDDPAHIRKALLQVSLLVDTPGGLNSEWLVQHHWYAVPVESACHFDEDDAARLSVAFSAFGCEDCLAIATEPLNSPSYFRVQTTIEGLLAFSNECAHFNLILVPEDVSLAVLCTVYDYYIVVGPKQFVTVAVGGDIIAARKQFKEFASSMEQERQRLLAVARKFEGLESADGAGGGAQAPGPES